MWREDAQTAGGRVNVRVLSPVAPPGTVCVSPVQASDRWAIVAAARRMASGGTSRTISARKA